MTFCCHTDRLRLEQENTQHDAVRPQDICRTQHEGRRYLAHAQPDLRGGDCECGEFAEARGDRGEGEGTRCQGDERKGKVDYRIVIRRG